MSRSTRFPRRLAFFGSSSIYGTADDQLGGFVNRLRLWYEAIDPRHRVYNLGIWGEQTSELIQRIDAEAARRRPHLIFIYPGFNDCCRVDSVTGPYATPLDEAGQLMRQLLSTASAIAPTIVMTGYPFDESRTQPYQGTRAFYRLQDARQYREQLLTIAQSMNLQVIDFFGELEGTDMTPMLAEDGLHGNSAGHQRLFEITKRFLESELSRPT